MISAIHATKVLLGSVLIIIGAVGFILPLIPGLPLVVWGFHLGFSWHPRGLRVWRRSRNWVFRSIRSLKKR